MRPEFYEIHAIIEGRAIRAVGWNFFDEPTIVFNSPPHVYYYHYEKKVLERCTNFWYLYRVKRIGACIEIDDFSIHITPKWFGVASRGV